MRLTGASWSSPQRGFTLIEVGIVITIIGLIIGGSVMGIRGIQEKANVSQTGQQLNRIELALLAYVIQNGCLPCPAKGDLDDSVTGAGWSNSDAGFYGPGTYTAAPPYSQPCITGAAVTGTICNANQGAGTSTGVVPWKSLGLAEGDIVDAWGSRISYAVTSTLALTASASMVRTAPAAYPAGTLSVQNNSLKSQTTAAAYVLISHGADRAFAFPKNGGTRYGDGYGTSGNAQGHNSPATTDGGDGQNFRQDALSPIPGSTYFDDMVRYRTAPVLIQLCGRNACGNPS